MKKMSTGIQDGLEFIFIREIRSKSLRHSAETAQFKFRELAPSGGYLVVMSLTLMIKLVGSPLREVQTVSSLTYSLSLTNVCC